MFWIIVVLIVVVLVESFIIWAQCKALSNLANKYLDAICELEPENYRTRAQRMGLRKGTGLSQCRLKLLFADSIIANTIVKK